jgi:CheY-like chemotaxis protein
MAQLIDVGGRGMPSAIPPTSITRAKGYLSVMPKILIVEDDSVVPAMLEDFLDQLGHQTETVTDGVQAIERAREFNPNLIIMDLMLPRMTGGEAARVLKHEPSSSDTPILAISGVERLDELVDMLSVDAVLTKPFDLSVLEERINELLDSSAENQATAE